MASELHARNTGGAAALRGFRQLSIRAQSLPIASRYAIAVATVTLAVAVRLALTPLWQTRLPYVTLTPAVVVSAWAGGLGPGLLATVLAAGSAAYFWMPPVGSFAVADPSDWLGLAVFVAMAWAIAGLNEIWRRDALALAESEQRLAVTLASIGDGVLTTDNDGLVSGLNEVAERLTGWSSAEASGRPIEEVLTLETGAGTAAPNPVRDVLRTGHASALADDTMLVSRDGRRIPIDDSAAPIRSGADVMLGAILVIRDVSERRRLDIDREARDQMARELAAIVETSDDAIVSKDLQSTVRSWNRGAERIFGYSAEEMVGRSIRTIIPVERWGEEDEVLRQLRQGNRVDHFETIRRRKDGSEVPVSLTISPLYSATGQVVGASKIARDISERRQAEAERARLLEREQQARADIERAGRLKDDFLAVLSHELRTPLNAVVGYTQLLLMGSLPPDEVQHAYHAIQRNAQAQVRLVESLLDLSRILAGKLEVSTEAVELASVIELAVDALRPEAIRKGVALEIAGSDGLRVVGDGPKLQQVFWNLLSNAIRFTPAGGRVRLEIERDGAHAAVRVIDNGRGIAPSLLPVVFDRFTQVEGENTRYRGGLGLGLALVRELVLAHKGTVTAHSAGEGHGATFTVRLPLLQALPLGAGDARPRRDGQDLRELRPDVLIVDDERDAREMLALVLESRGARTRTVDTAAAAYDEMVERTPDVLLADVGMAGEDGYTLIRRWRTREHDDRRPRIAAIAVTAYATPRDREEALAAGFDWHIAKPVDADELVRVIAAMSGSRRTVS